MKKYYFQVFKVGLYRSNEANAPFKKVANCESNYFNSTFCASKI